MFHFLCTWKTVRDPQSGGSGNTTPVLTATVVK